MEKIQLAKKFTAKVQNSKRLRVQADFNGTRLFCEIVSKTGKSHPEISLCSQDNVAEIIFLSDHYVGDVYDMVVTQQEKVVKTYDKPPVKKSVAGQQYFRAEIKKSQDNLFPYLRHTKAVSFDQSYFTRTIGQNEILKKVNVSGATLFSGAGFGALQAFWCALGWDAEDLQKFFCVNLRNAIKKGLFRKGVEVTASILLDSNFERLSPKHISKELEKVFSINKRQLKVRDCKHDVFIPIQDISGRTMVIDKSEFASMPIHVAVGASLFDPVFFKTKKYFSHMGILNGDVVKNNDWLMARNNPGIKTISIGSPVRCFDKGFSEISRADLALKISDQKHETDLMMSDDCGSVRYQCKPIDEVYQFSTSGQAIELALNSGDINV